VIGLELRENLQFIPFPLQNLSFPTGVVFVFSEGVPRRSGLDGRQDELGPALLDEISRQIIGVQALHDHDDLALAGSIQSAHGRSAEPFDGVLPRGI
jgi:hypothetical protein